MMHKKLPRRTVFQLGLPLCLAGCAAEEEAPTGEEEAVVEKRVTVFSWWIAPSEADALKALVAVHNVRYPQEEIYNAAVASGGNAREVLAQQLAENRPPDLFQESANTLPRFLAENPGGLVPLTELFTEEGLYDVLVPEVIADVTVDGEIYGMPVNIHRENALHYNKQIFADLELEVPTTLDELLVVCAKLKEAGITPFATTLEAWVLRILFNAIVSSSMGAAAYQRYFLGQAPLNETAMATAIAVFDEILTSYVNASAGDPAFGWTDAADLVLNGEAAMFIHGDWAKGYFTQIGWEPGTGFGVVGMPGASDLFQYVVDTFALPVGASEPEAAKHFLRTIASKAGQAAFNKLKGSSPARLDTNVEDLDVVGNATLEDLRNASIRMLTVRKDSWDLALADFAVSHDKAALLAAFVDDPPNQ